VHTPPPPPPVRWYGRACAAHAHTLTHATIHPRAKQVTGGARDRYRPKVALAATPIIIIITSLSQ